MRTGRLLKVLKSHERVSEGGSPLNFTGTCFGDFERGESGGGGTRKRSTFRYLRNPCDLVETGGVSDRVFLWALEIHILKNKGSSFRRGKKRSPGGPRLDYFGGEDRRMAIFRIRALSEKGHIPEGRKKRHEQAQV